MPITFIIFMGIIMLPTFIPFKGYLNQIIFYIFLIGLSYYEIFFN